MSILDCSSILYQLEIIIHNYIILDMRKRFSIQIGRFFTVRRRNKSLYTVHYTMHIQSLRCMRESNKQSSFFAAR